MKKYLLPIIVSLLFAGSVMGATVFNIQQGGTNNGSAPTTGSLIYFDGTSYDSTDTATSTSQNGINISDGCFAVSGSCIGGGGSSLWTDNGAYLSPTGGEFIDVSYLVATATNATSTFAGGVQFGAFDTYYSTSTNGLYVDNAFLGPQLFEADGGIVSWIDMPVSSTPADNTVESYTASLDGNPMLTIYGLADGSGDVDTLRFGFGTTSPATYFVVSDSNNATTTVEYGEFGNTGSFVCHNTKNTAGSDISFYFVGTTMVVESNRCN